MLSVLTRPSTSSHVEFRSVGSAFSPLQGSAECKISEVVNQGFQELRTHLVKPPTRKRKSVEVKSDEAGPPQAKRLKTIAQRTDPSSTHHLSSTLSQETESKSNATGQFVLNTSSDSPRPVIVDKEKESSEITLEQEVQEQLDLLGNQNISVREKSDPIKKFSGNIAPRLHNLVEYLAKHPNQETYLSKQSKGYISAIKYIKLLRQGSDTEKVKAQKLMEIFKLENLVIPARRVYAIQGSVDNTRIAILYPIVGKIIPGRISIFLKDLLRHLQEYPDRKIFIPEGEKEGILETVRIYVTKLKMQDDPKANQIEELFFTKDSSKVIFGPSPLCPTPPSSTQQDEPRSVPSANVPTEIQRLGNTRIFFKDKTTDVRCKGQGVMLRNLLRYVKDNKDKVIDYAFTALRKKGLVKNFNKYCLLLQQKNPSSAESKRLRKVFNVETASKACFTSMASSSSTSSAKSTSVNAVVLSSDERPMVTSAPQAEQRVMNIKKNYGEKELLVSLRFPPLPPKPQATAKHEQLSTDFMGIPISTSGHMLTQQELDAALLRAVTTVPVVKQQTPADLIGIPLVTVPYSLTQDQSDAAVLNAVSLAKGRKEFNALAVRKDDEKSQTQVNPLDTDFSSSSPDVSPWDAYSSPDDPDMQSPVFPTLEGVEEESTASTLTDVQPSFCLLLTPKASPKQLPQK